MNAVGRAVVQVAGGGSSTGFTYGELGTVDAVVDGEGGSMVFAHDGNGNVTSVTDAGGGQIGLPWVCWRLSGVKR